MGATCRETILSKSLEKKYEELARSHNMHRDFKTEADTPWQFANDYTSIPSELELANMDSDARDPL